MSHGGPAPVSSPPHPVLLLHEGCFVSTGYRGRNQVLAVGLDGWEWEEMCGESQPPPPELPPSRALALPCRAPMCQEGTMTLWQAMQRGHRAPCTEPQSLWVLLVQVLHQALPQTLYPAPREQRGTKGGDRKSYSSSPPHSFSRAFLYSPDVSSWKSRWR